jgi:hypothetical protein
LKGKKSPLVDNQYLLQKFPGKGGWTYAAIPEVEQPKRIPFGWVRVKGTIDAFDIGRSKLMPMGNGQLFFPVNAEIRKKIKKKAGDIVHIVLYSDEHLGELPWEIMECFQNEPSEIYQNFLSLSNEDQKAYIDWIYDAKSDDLKVNRIIKMMERLKSGLTLYGRD